MTFGPSTSNADLADALDELHNALNEGTAQASMPNLELLNEAATRIRELDQLDEITLRPR